MLEFVDNHFWKKLSPNEYIMADKGFKGLDSQHPTCLPFFDDTKEIHQEFNNELAHYRIIVENVFAEIKKWKICSLPLSLKFSNINDALDRHNKLWTVVGAFTNMFHNFGR